MRYLSPFYNSPFSNSLYGSEFSDLFDNFLTTEHASEVKWQPRADVEEHANHFLMSFDLPGVQEKDIKIEVKDGYLTVTGERKQEHKSEEEGRYKRYERFHGSFSRSFSLPKNLESDDIKANYDNGVLHVLVPKKDHSESKSVKVESGKKDSLLSRILS